MASQPSFDKQFVRDYLETLHWDKTPPAPELPEEIVLKTRFIVLSFREQRRQNFLKRDDMNSV